MIPAKSKAKIFTYGGCRRPLPLVRFGGWILVLVLLVVSVTACGVAADSSTPTAATPKPSSVPLDSSSLNVSGTSLHSLEGTLEGTYAKVNPSVVNIRVVQKREVTFPDISGFPFFGLPSHQQPQEQYSTGLGSGFVLDKEGHIVTNNHVVDGADTITVTFYDGTTASGRLVGADPDSDLAVIKVDTTAEHLAPVTMADSDQVKVGQMAIAIGNPFGLQSTMTVGVVSAVGRSLPVDSGNGSSASYSIPEIIQTDAPINPGNSGGVLLDSTGKLIGVTSAIISPVQASAGIGFAIPSDIVQKVVPALIDTGQYVHPWLGASLVSLNPDLAKAMNLGADQQGALVVNVAPNSPAYESGLRGSDRQVTIEGQQVRVGGDVVVAVGDRNIKRVEDLIDYLERNTEPDQEVVLTVLRSGKEQTITATLAKRPTPDNSSNASETRTGNAWLGIEGLTMNSDISAKMELTSDQKGVLVEQVSVGSPADRARMQGSFTSAIVNGRPVLVGGDVIIKMDGQAVNNVQDLQALIDSAQPGQEVAVTVLRDGIQVDLQVVLGNRPLNDFGL